MPPQARGGGAGDAVIGASHSASDVHSLLASLLKTLNELIKMIDRRFAATQAPGPASGTTATAGSPAPGGSSATATAPTSGGSSTTTHAVAPTVASPATASAAAPASYGPVKGAWVSAEELASRPMSGPEWDALLAKAEAPMSSANVADQNSNHDTETLAVALAAARTGRADLRAKATNALLEAIGTEQGARWLAVGRNLGSYAIAADVLGLRADGDPSSAGTRVQDWLSSFLTMRLAHDNNGTPITMRESAWASGSNASAQEGFAHAAVASYLGDSAELAWGWDAFRRYAGDRTSPHTMTANDDSWQQDPSDPVGIQNAGATRNGVNIDGALGNDMSRGGSLAGTPGYTQYPWVGLEGAVPAAAIYARAGYPAFEIQDQAIHRAVDYLWRLRQSTGDSSWFDGRRSDEIIQIVNHAYGTTYPISSSSVGDGRTIGYTDFTHAT